MDQLTDADAPPMSDLDTKALLNGHPPRLALRPREAAEAIGISARKLWELTADQTSGIPHCRFGKRVVYPVDQLRQWLAERAQKNGGRRE